MTTSWALATHGQWVAALRAHAVGTLLAVAALVAAVASLGVAARGRLPAWKVTDRLAAAVGVTFVGLLIAEWIVRVASG